MVALNKHFAPENPHTVEENRVGIFFGESTKSSRANPLSAQEPRLKKAYCYDETASGMFYYGYRYYDPATGRWPNRDPIAEQGGINLYGFVGNNGVNFWDVIGLHCQDCQQWWSDCMDAVKQSAASQAADVIAEFDQLRDDAESVYDSAISYIDNKYQDALDKCDSYDDGTASGSLTRRVCRDAALIAKEIASGTAWSVHKLAVAAALFFKSGEMIAINAWEADAERACGNGKAQCEAEYGLDENGCPCT